jgi:uncharacterized protein (TIGR02001 family)
MMVGGNLLSRSASGAAALLVTGALMAGSALADGYDKKKGSLKDAPAEAPKSDLQITGNFALTTDYVFRGFSQTAEQPTVQAGVDLTYKWFYAGIWGSGLDFGRDLTVTGNDFAHVEVDLYAGIKPVIGRFTFDIGGIYYTYPGARDGDFSIFRELDYFEFKFGVSAEAWKDATIGVTAFYSPEYTNKTGKVWTIEGAFSQVLPKVRDTTPTFSALIGYQKGEDIRYLANVTNFDGDDYFYWNAGINLGFHERFSVDFRYWDTNVKSNNAAGGGIDGFCTGRVFQCDERFVVTGKVTY